MFVLVPLHNETRSMNSIHNVTPYIQTSNFKGERKGHLIIVLQIFKEDSGKMFLLIVYLQYKQLINSRSMNNQSSRICEASVEALMVH